MDNGQVSIVQGVCGALEEMKHFIRMNAVKYRCHIISPETLQELVFRQRENKGCIGNDKYFQ